MGKEKEAEYDKLERNPLGNRRKLVEVKLTPHPEVNTKGIQNPLNILSEMDTEQRVIKTSTASIYKGIKTPTPENGAKEDHVGIMEGPFKSYTQSKLEQELNEKMPRMQHHGEDTEPHPLRHHRPGSWMWPSTRKEEIASKKTDILEETIRKGMKEIPITQLEQIQEQLQEKGMYMRRFDNMDQTLPVELEWLAEEEPEKYLSIIKLIEYRIKYELLLEEIKNPEEADNQIEIIKYAKKCGIDTKEAQKRIIKQLNKIEQEYRKRLKGIRKAKERIEPE